MRRKLHKSFVKLQRGRNFYDDARLTQRCNHCFSERSFLFGENRAQVDHQPIFFDSRNHWCPIDWPAEPLFERDSGIAMANYSD